MDPLQVFPVEVVINILQYIELEELLLSTREICRNWNALVKAHLPHLMVASYFVRVEFSRNRIDVPLKLRRGSDLNSEYVLESDSIVQQRIHETDDVRYFSISAGVVNQSVNRTFMSNHSQPIITCLPDARRVEARVDRVDYSNPFTNTGNLNSINLKIELFAMFEENDRIASRMKLSIGYEELAKWIVQCRLAQGYRTPQELREIELATRRLVGIGAPYQGFKNSAGIWGPVAPRVCAA